MNEYNTVHILTAVSIAMAVLIAVPVAISY